MEKRAGMEEGQSETSGPGESKKKKHQEFGGRET